MLQITVTDKRHNSPDEHKFSVSSDQARLKEHLAKVLAATLSVVGERAGLGNFYADGEKIQHGSLQFEIGELDFGGANSLFVRLDRWFRGMQSGKSILGPAIKFKRQGEEIKINIDQHLQKTSKTHQEVLKAIEACHSTLSRSNSAAFFPVEEGGVTEAATGHACAGSFK